MPYADLFPALPDDARCWIYAAEHPLSEAEQQALLDELNAFFDGWTSHGRPVQGAATILDGQFLVVAGTIPGGDISGCGIDASVHAVEAAAARQGVAWASPLRIFYRHADGTVRHVTRGAFRRSVAAGEVTAETLVFDVSLTLLGAMRGGGFEQPAGQAWHARVFKIPQPA